MSRSHDAAPVKAMAEPNDMAKLMDGFLDQAFPKQIGIWRQTIELLPQTMNGNEGAAAAELRLAKQESQDGDKKVQVRYTEARRLDVAGQRLHALQDSRGIVLVAARIVGKVNVERIFVHVARNLEDAS